MLQVSISSVFENRLDVEVHKFFARVFKNINVSIKKKDLHTSSAVKEGEDSSSQEFHSEAPFAEE